MITLRPYQQHDIASIRAAFATGARAPLYVLPTGAGKTVTFSAIAESAARRSRRGLILSHRTELIDQIDASLQLFGIRPDIICAGYARRASHVAVASVQTLVRRLDDYAEPDLIIIDECHHVAAGTWTTILRKYSRSKVLGVTATPLRLDGRGLAAYFDRMIVGPTIEQLISLGFLSQPRVFAPPTVDTSGLHTKYGEFKADESESLMDKPSITGDALAHYQKLAAGQTALAFCTSVTHAEHLAQQFRAAGVAAVALSGNMDRQIRRQAVQDFRDRKIMVLASCDLFSEGFDVPGVFAGIMLRPTNSLGMHMQQCGRVLRTAPGKTHALILDHVGNCQRHGLPQEGREWDLTQDVMHSAKKKRPKPRICLSCFAASAAGSRVCSNCGEPFPVEPRADIKKKDGELVELTAEQIARKRELQTRGRAQTLEQLQEFGRAKGYASGWAQHIWDARQRKQQGGRSSA